MIKPDYREWQEAVLTLTDAAFFDVIRLYLGEIKTPFNKQRLVEQLGGFFSKPHIQQIIQDGLSRTDLMILTAVTMLKDPSAAVLQYLFSDDFSVTAHLLNMEERLLIYRTVSKKNPGGKIYSINPFLYDALLPLLKEDIFFIPQRVSAIQKEATAADDMILAGLYCFLLRKPDMLKKDGSFKHKTAKILAGIFPAFAGTDSLRILCTGLQNIGLLIQNDSVLIPQEERWAEFFKLTVFERKMYTAAGVCGKARRDELYHRTQVFSVFLSSLKSDYVYSSGALHRLAYFAVQRFYHEKGKAYHQPEMTRSMTADTGIRFETLLVDTAQTLGFLLGDSEGSWQLNQAVFSSDSKKQPPIASSSFEITALPYTAFESILPILDCLEPVSIQASGIFEITRSACARCFEKNISADQLLERLYNAVPHGIPQNVSVSISEWYTQYTAIGLYHGFVLSIAPEKRSLFQNNPALKTMVQKELTDGVYLIKNMELDAIRAMIKNTGCEVTFYNTEPIEPYNPLPLKQLAEPVSVPSSAGQDLSGIHDELVRKEKDYAVYCTMLEDQLDASVFSEDDIRILKQKIQKKLIICKEQLTKTSVAGEIHEVSGLDFLGKIHLAERAITDGCLLEIYMDQGSADCRKITGKPVSIEKTADGAVVVLQTKGGMASEKISIARIVRMVMIKESLFS